MQMVQNRPKTTSVCIHWWESSWQPLLQPSCCISSKMCWRTFSKPWTSNIGISFHPASSMFSKMWQFCNVFMVIVRPCLQPSYWWSFLVAALCPHCGPPIQHAARWIQSVVPSLFHRIFLLLDSGVRFSFIWPNPRPPSCALAVCLTHCYQKSVWQGRCN